MKSAAFLLLLLIANSVFGAPGYYDNDDYEGNAFILPISILLSIQTYMFFRFVWQKWTLQ